MFGRPETTQQRLIFAGAGIPAPQFVGDQWFDTTTSEWKYCTSLAPVTFAVFATPIGPAPASANYVVLSLDGVLTAERVLTAGTNITLTDNGPGATLIIDAASGSTTSNPVPPGQDGADGEDGSIIPGPAGADGIMGTDGASIPGQDGEDGSDQYILLPQSATFIASGPAHAPGSVPDPGAIAGSAKFLCEDAVWRTPTATVAFTFDGGNTPDRLFDANAVNDIVADMGAP